MPLHLSAISQSSCYTIPPTPFHTASSISHPPFFTQQPSSSIVHRLTYIRLKNTMFVLRALSLRWRAFPFYGCNFTMKHQKRLHGLHRRSERHPGVLPRFQFAKYSESWPESIPKTTLTDSRWTISWLRAIVLLMALRFSHDNGISWRFWRLFLWGKFCEGTDPRKNAPPPAYLF